jgi:hypothetical protein
MSYRKKKKHERMMKRFEKGMTHGQPGCYTTNINVRMLEKDLMVMTINTTIKSNIFG